METQVEIIRKGYYINNSIKSSIFILKQNWDFFYEEGYDEEMPDLDENGFAYYVIYGDYTDLLYANRSTTCVSIREALELAEETINANILWLGSVENCSN